MAQEAPARRTATPQHWHEALERAKANGLVAFNVAGDPRSWFVTSAQCPPDRLHNASLA